MMTARDLTYLLMSSESSPPEPDAVALRGRGEYPSSKFRSRQILTHTIKKQLGVTEAAFQWGREACSPG